MGRARQAGQRLSPPRIATDHISRGLSRTFHGSQSATDGRGDPRVKACDGETRSRISISHGRTRTSTDRDLSWARIGFVPATPCRHQANASGRSRGKPCSAGRKNAASAYRPQNAAWGPIPTPCRRPTPHFSRDRAGLLQRLAVRTPRSVRTGWLLSDCDQEVESDVEARPAVRVFANGCRRLLAKRTARPADARVGRHQRFSDPPSRRSRRAHDSRDFKSSR
jgi:hypothetical protein